MNLYRSKSLAIFILLLAAAFLPVTSLARSESVNCFDYYKFGVAGVFDNLHTEKGTYSPGDNAYISYDLVSKMDAPIVEGLVRIQIFYNDPKNGEELIEEFIAQNDLSLKKGDKIPYEFTWNIPKGADSGEYLVKAYLISGDMFNLLGLSFLPYGPPGVPGEETKFRVINNDKVSSMHLDKSKTTLNGVQYSFGDFSPQLAKDKQVTVATRLVNKGLSKKVDINYEIYSWDDVIGSPIQDYTKKETATLDANGAKDLSFSVPSLPTGTYLLKVTATTFGEKSIVKMRFSVGGVKGRYVFAGLTNFPMVKNEKNTIFFCLANSADRTTFFNGKGSVELKDEKGVTVFKESWGPREITPDPRGVKIDFVPTQDLSVATLKVALSDEAGNHMDDSVIKYDISKFRNINSVFDIKLDKSVYNFGDTMRYTISYKGPSGSDLKGDLVVYLLNPYEIVVYAIEKTQINGEFSDNIKLMGKSGSYKLVARELTHDIKAVQAFNLAEKTAVKSSTESPATKAKTSNGVSSSESSSMSIVYAILVVLLIGIAYYLMTNKAAKTAGTKAKKGGR